jgi:hypothetical protein
MSERTCSICGNSYPLDKDHFRWRVQNGKGYFTADCKGCRRAQKKASDKKKQAKREEGLQAIERAGADVFLAAVKRGGANIPHSAEVIERVFEYFGGVGGFSAVLVKQYYDASPGGSARNRLLETICRLVSKNVEQGGARKPLSLWSEEELEQELNRRFEQAVASFSGTTINVQAEEAKTIAAQEAEASANLAAACHPLLALPDAVRAGQHQGNPERDTGAATGGPAALPPEPEPRSDPRQHSE